eukprot:jgi/Mesvir1/15699/Mv03285-RA.2
MEHPAPDCQGGADHDDLELDEELERAFSLNKGREIRTARATADKDDNSDTGVLPLSSKLAFEFPGWDVKLEKPGSRKQCDAGESALQTMNVDGSKCPAGGAAGTAANQRPRGPLRELPSEVLVRIFENLSLREVCNAACVCKHWHAAAMSDDDLWCSVLWPRWCKQEGIPPPYASHLRAMAPFVLEPYGKCPPPPASMPAQAGPSALDVSGGSRCQPRERSAGEALVAVGQGAACLIPAHAVGAHSVIVTHGNQNEDSQAPPPLQDARMEGGRTQGGRKRDAKGKALACFVTGNATASASATGNATASASATGNATASASATGNAMASASATGNATVAAASGEASGCQLLQREGRETDGGAVVEFFLPAAAGNGVLVAGALPHCAKARQGSQPPHHAISYAQGSPPRAVPRVQTSQPMHHPLTGHASQPPPHAITQGQASQPHGSLPQPSPVGPSTTMTSTFQLPRGFGVLSVKEAVTRARLDARLSCSWAALSALLQVFDALWASMAADRSADDKGGDTCVATGSSADDKGDDACVGVDRSAADNCRVLEDGDGGPPAPTVVRAYSSTDATFDTEMAPVKPQVPVPSLTPMVSLRHHGQDAPLNGSINPHNGSTSPLNGSMNPLNGSINPLNGSINPHSGCINLLNGSINPLPGSRSIEDEPINPAIDLAHSPRHSQEKPPLPALMRVAQVSHGPDRSPLPPLPPRKPHHAGEKPSLPSLMPAAKIYRLVQNLTVADWSLLYEAVAAAFASRADLVLVELKGELAAATNAHNRLQVESDTINFDQLAAATGQGFGTMAPAAIPHDVASATLDSTMHPPLGCDLASATLEKLDHQESALLADGPPQAAASSKARQVVSVTVIDSRLSSAAVIGDHLSSVTVIGDHLSSATVIANHLPSAPVMDNHLSSVTVIDSHLSSATPRREGKEGDGKAWGGQGREHKRGGTEWWEGQGWPGGISGRAAVASGELTDCLSGHAQVICGDQRTEGGRGGETSLSQAKGTALWSIRRGDRGTAAGVPCREPVAVPAAPFLGADEMVLDADSVGEDGRLQGQSNGLLPGADCRGGGDADDSHMTAELAVALLAVVQRQWQRYRQWLMLVCARLGPLNHEVAAERARSAAFRGQSATPTLFGKGAICFRGQVMLAYGVRRTLQGALRCLLRREASGGGHGGGVVSEAEMDTLVFMAHLEQVRTVHGYI